MYSWDGRTDGWRGSKGYSYDARSKARREREAARAKAKGPRTYGATRGPNPKVIDPKKKLVTTSRNPVVIAVDVTGSMARWPAEIFDRLPLLFTTLSQYRDDVEICFAAIGDEHVDSWPLQVTTFASGYDLEQQLGSLFGEGGGGDAPESYGLFAHWLLHHVTAEDVVEKPFLIVFGDITMHPTVSAEAMTKLLGDDAQADANAIDTWRAVAKKWDVWFLRRPGGISNDKVDKQWARAIGADRILHIDDELRAVDYAMGIIARTWGFFGNFQDNMLARQDAGKVDAVSDRIRKANPRPLKCPQCGGPVPPSALKRHVCEFCATTIVL